MEPILQSIFESAVDGIIVIDARGLIKAFNPAAERLFGYRADEVLGPERQAADAQPRSRAARPLHRELSEHEGPENHRNRPRGAWTTQGREHISSPSLGGRNGAGRRAGVHGHPSRSQPPRRDRGSAQEERRALAIDRRIGSRRDRRHRRSRARFRRSTRQPSGCSATRSATSSVATSTC